MRPLSISIAFLLLFFSQGSSQQRLQILGSKLLAADSVFIVSHEATAGISIVDEKTRRPLPPPKLIVNSQLNAAIIHEKCRLTDTALQRFATIITRPFQDTVIERVMCFIPHHAVVLYSKGKPSYIDMCFGCLGIATSKDITITADDFDFRKWNELVAFFRQKGMIYELDFAEKKEED